MHSDRCVHSRSSCLRTPRGHQLSSAVKYRDRHACRLTQRSIRLQVHSSVNTQRDQRERAAKINFSPQQLQQNVNVGKLKGQWEHYTATALYKYFIWRKDAFSDLQAITLLVVSLIFATVVGKVVFLGQSGVAAWDDFYAAAVTTFGESWPSTTAPIPEQVSSICLYLSGLICFAVLLALVEQSVLQVYETRVELGSPVQETGHILVLCWCRSQSDISKLEVILKQLCAAYSAEGGRTLVVLSQRKKTDMEDLFFGSIPQHQRGGSRFVFRQGNPLTAADHRLVAADEASAVLVLADSAACADASDSQVLRVLVLLDEAEAAARQEGRDRPRPGHVVAEVLSNDAMPLLRFMPTKAVLPLPSHRANACRLARLVTRPVVSHLTDQLWDFENSCAVYMHTFPELAGKTIADVSFMFPDGIVLGLLEGSTGFVLINPPPEYTLNTDEQIILLRPTDVKQSAVKPLSTPVSAPIGSYSPEAAAAAWRSSQQSLNMPMVISCGCDTDVLDEPPSTLSAVQDIDNCQDQQPDHQLKLREALAVRNLQPQSVSSNPTDDQQQQKHLQQLQRSYDSGAALQQYDGDDWPQDAAGSPQQYTEAGAAARRSIAAALRSLPDGGCAVASWESDSDLPMQAYEVMDLLQGTRPGYNTCRMFSLAESSVQLSRKTALNLLVLGWGDTAFMSQLLLALATGPTALPAGSRVTFANSHSVESSLQPAVESAGPQGLLSSLVVDHVQLDPLVRGQLSRLGQALQTADAAIVLCDTCWRYHSRMQTLQLTNPAVAAAAADSHAAVYGSGSPGSSLSSEGLSGGLGLNTSTAYLNGQNPGGSGGTPALGTTAAGFGGDADVLQLDALLLRVQLNLRSMLQEMGRERGVNIITEKVGTEQETRFEDKARLPLGVPVNLASYTACIMSQLAFCPMMILPRTLGAQIDPLIVDADLYTGVGDKVSFWQLMKRAQLLGHVLLGYYLLPVSASDPIEAVICPPGDSRYEQRVWNTGDNRLKFVVLQDAAEARARESSSAVAAAVAAVQQQEEQQEEVQSRIWENMAATTTVKQPRDVWKSAADTTATYYPVDGDWQWWMR